MQLRRHYEVVFYGVARPQYVRVLAALYRADAFELRLEAHRGRKVLDVDLAPLRRYRFEEDGVSILFGELYYLVVDGRAVSGPLSFEPAHVERRLLEVFPYDFVRLGVGAREAAYHAAVDALFAEVREGLRLVYAFLAVERGPVYRVEVEARRRVGAQAAYFEARFFQRVGQLPRGRHAERPGLAAAEAGVYLRGEVRPGREHDARGEERLSRRDFDAARLAVFDYELRRLALVEVEIFLRQERGAVVVAVAPRAALRAQRAHRRALRGVEPAQVLRRVVGRRGALAAERVYLAHDVALRGAAYRRIAGHHRYAVDVYAEQQRPRAHP